MLQNEILLPLPQLAPLSRPLIDRLIYHLVDTTSVQEAVSRYPDAVSNLIRVLPDVRNRVFSIMDPVVRDGHLSTGTFLSRVKEFSPAQARPTDQLISFWRSRGIVKPGTRGTVNAQDVAGVLVVRLLLPQVTRNWLPPEIPVWEPDWWCWRQDALGVSPIPYAVPFSGDVPGSSLLWTVWPGATWNQGWVRIAGGAMYVPPVTGQDMIQVAEHWHIRLDPTSKTRLLSLQDYSDNTGVIHQLWMQIMQHIPLQHLNTPS